MCAGNVKTMPMPEIASFRQRTDVVFGVLPSARASVAVCVVARARGVGRDRQCVYQYKHRHDNKSNNSLFHIGVSFMLIGSCQPNICRVPTEVVRLSRAFGLTQVRDWRQ